jgi:hypothetical protein
MPGHGCAVLTERSKLAAALVRGAREEVPWLYRAQALTAVASSMITDLAGAVVRTLNVLALIVLFSRMFGALSLVLVLGFIDKRASPVEGIHRTILHGLAVG